MPTTTDPARELVDLCRLISRDTSPQPGDQYLATNFGVKPWSSEFFELNFIIIKRIDNLKDIVSTLLLDEDIKEESVTNLSVISEAFGPNGHRNPWSHSVKNYLTPATLGPLPILSGLVRPSISYPKLNEDERDELIALVDTLLEWLRDHQLAEQDFIRQALIDGLNGFHFRLSRITWVGWGYTIDSLRDVIGAYFALEKATPTDGTNTPAQAALKHVGGLVRAIYEKTKFMKEFTETGDFMLRAYGGVTLAIQAAPQVTGLLSG